jgi:hypothetical protein
MIKGHRKMAFLFVIIARDLESNPNFYGDKRCIILNTVL